MATNNSWNNAISAANSAITLNSGTNTVSVSTDASATTVNIGTGAAAKTVTVGSTNTTSALTLNSGSGGITGFPGFSTVVAIHSTRIDPSAPGQTYIVVKSFNASQVVFPNVCGGTASTFFWSAIGF